MESFADWVAITGSATADAESAASSMAVSPGAVIKKIWIRSYGGVGNVYGVKIDTPGISSPQKYLAPSNTSLCVIGALLGASKNHIDCDIPLPKGASTINITVYADTASSTCVVGIEWEAA